MLVTSDITLLWPMEFYTHKGQKLLYEGMEIVSTARLPYGGMKQVTENTGKFPLCNSLIEKYPQIFQPLLFASRSVEEHVKKSKLAGSWAETVDIFSCATLLKRTISTFSTKEKSGSLLTLSRSLIFRLLWKQRRVVNVLLL